MTQTAEGWASLRSRRSARPLDPWNDDLLLVFGEEALDEAGDL